MRIFFTKISISLVSFLFVANAWANNGYVFCGDINKDGIVDKMESGDGALFGNAGGPFVVTLSQGNNAAKKFVLALHPLAVTIEDQEKEDPEKYHVRIWSYWHMSANNGSLCAHTIGGDKSEPVTECITIYPRTDLGNSLYDTVFAEGKRINFQIIGNYHVPPQPDGVEWGK